MEIIERGILNAGAVGTRRAVSTFPNVTRLGDGSLLACYRVGSTKDSDDETLELRASRDDGRTWSEPSSPFGNLVGSVRGSLKVGYITPLSGRKLVIAAMWVDREAYPGKGLFNAETEGCLPMKILLGESEDLGQTWSPLREVPMAEELGPPSLTSPLLTLPSGRWALSVETNKSYLDGSKWYQRVVHVHTDDGGRTWEAPVVVNQDPQANIFHWDQRTAVAPDGRMVSFAWTYDRVHEKYVNVHRRVSHDEGRTWSEREDLGFADQPSRPAILPDGRVVLAWVDRFGTGSIRARVAKDLDGPFPPDSEVVLFESTRRAGHADTGALLVDMADWSYGLPYAEGISANEALVVYYAGTAAEMSIHSARLRV